MRLAVDQHGADPAGALPAAEFRRGIADAVAQRGEQVRAAIDEHRNIVTVMLELNGSFHASHPVPASRRLRCTATISRRYHVLAIASVGGLVPSAATATAAAMPLSSSALPSSARSTDRARIGIGPIAP